MENLWPESIAFSEEQLTPVSILKWQASLLGETTRNLVKAELSLRATPNLSNEIKDAIYHDFYIVAPLFKNYRFRLFTTLHKLTKIYPIEIYLEEQLSEELYGTKDNEIKSLPIENEEQLLFELKKILGSKTTMSVIRTFSSQTPEDQTKSAH